MGGFDLDAAQAVGADSDVERYQTLDQLALLIDKSLVVAEDSHFGTRYRMLETVRQYALEKLGESGEADAVRDGRRDHYATVAAQLDSPGRTGHQRLVEQAEIEMDNLRAAFAWLPRKRGNHNRTAARLDVAAVVADAGAHTGRHCLARCRALRCQGPRRGSVARSSRPGARRQGRTRGNAKHPREHRRGPASSCYRS